MMYNVEYCCMDGDSIDTNKNFMFKNNVIQLAVFGTPSIHCFPDCASLLMLTEIEMIYVTLMYIKAFTNYRMAGNIGGNYIWRNTALSKYCLI